MNNDYEDLLEFLETDGGSALYSQRELHFSRVSFESEKTLYGFIRDGKPDEMIAFYKDMLLHSPGLKIPVGITAVDHLRQMKYAAVSAVAIACRAAILGGVGEAAAYGRSDDAILRIDGLKTVPTVLKCEVQTLLEFARMVQRSKPREYYSAEIRTCMERITAHTHSPLRLEELAEGSGYSKEYLAKRFKQEVGMPISEYMLQARMEEAKTLISSGMSCGDVAHTLGFSSQSHFIRRFKDATGMTPKLYAAKKQR